MFANNPSPKTYRHTLSSHYSANYPANDRVFDSQHQLRLSVRPDQRATRTPAYTNQLRNLS